MTSYTRENYDERHDNAIGCGKNFVNDKAKIMTKALFLFVFKKISLNGQVKTMAWTGSYTCI